MPKFRISETAPFFRGGALVAPQKSPGAWVVRYKARLFGALLSLDEDQAAPNQDVIVDILRGGVSIFSNSAHRPRILAGNYYADSQWEPLGEVIVANRGDKIRVQIDQCGTNPTPGYGLTVEVEYSYVE